MANNMQQQCPDELHAGAVITVKEVVLVKPLKPTLRHCMYLSATDMLMRISKPLRNILFYPPSSNSKDNITDRPTFNAFTIVKQGLAAALTPYYPFAGRLALDDTGRLVLDCNDAGIELTCCQCDTMLFSDLMVDNYVPRSFFRQLIPMNDLPRSDHTDVPVTAVQITAFSGGGFTVGIATQHSIADGFAVWMFMKTLGQACRGEPLTVQPSHWRAVLRPDTVKLNCKFAPAPKQMVKQDIVTTSTDDAYSYSLSSSPTERLMQVVVHLSKEAIDSLKKAACLSCTSTDSVTPDSTFTTYHALSAYLWKRYIMARGLSAKTPVQFLHLLDFRQRIVPPLTSGYCGNAIAGFFTVSKAGDIQQESLGMTAARIRQTIQDVDDYSIKVFVEDVEHLDLSNVPINWFHLRNASRFPFYEAGDLGWGEPAAVRQPASDTEGEATLYPSSKSGGIDVVFALLQTTCSRYFSSTLFPNDPLDISQLEYTTAVCM